NNTLTNVGVQSNTLTGVKLFGGAKVTLRKLRIQGSGGDGINIADDGMATSLAGIDLGNSADPGLNEISGSVDSHICVGTTYALSRLNAEGNTFGPVDCSVVGTSGTVRTYVDCAGHGGGVNDVDALLRDSVAHCSLLPQ